MARTSRSGNSNRLLCLLATCLLLFSSCSDNLISRIEFNHPGGSFDQAIDTTEARKSFSFLVFSDLHYGRTESGFYLEEEAFLAWLDTYPSTLAFALHLGDGTAYSLESEYRLYRDFLDMLEDRSIEVHAVLGNHDVREYGRTLFIRYINPLTARRFSYKGISFYLLDTGNASLGKVQLDNLMSSVADDPNPKIFCGHVPLYGGPDMFYFSLKDPHERALLVKTMVQNKVGLYLGGHLHINHKLYSYTDTNHEFVCESFHGRDSLIENTLPVWYVFTYDAPSNRITIFRYALKRDGAIGESVVTSVALP